VNLRVPCGGRVVTGAGGPGNIPGWSPHGKCDTQPGTASLAPRPHHRPPRLRPPRRHPSAHAMNLPKNPIRAATAGVEHLLLWEGLQPRFLLGCPVGGASAPISAGLSCGRGFSPDFCWAESEQRPQVTSMQRSVGGCSSSLSIRRANSSSPAYSLFEYLFNGGASNTRAAGGVCHPLCACNRHSLTPGAARRLRARARRCIEAPAKDLPTTYARDDRAVRHRSRQPQDLTRRRPRST